MLTADFAIEGFRFDAASGRYRWSDGVGKGRFAAKRTVLEYARRSIVRHSNDLIGLADKLENGSIDLTEFQRQAAAELRQVHLLQAFTAAQGSENLFANDYLIVARELKIQMHAGRDVNGLPFGLKKLASDIAMGNVSKEQLQRRLKLFAQSGRRTYWNIVQAKNADKFGFRVLGKGSQSCPECRQYANEEPKSVSQIVPIATGCSCLNSCNCSIRVFETLEEALRAKY